MSGMLEKLQSIGKALMLPIAVLPAAALLLRLGAPDVFNIPFITKAGGAVFLGIDGVVMKCHGSAKETSFKNTLFQAETAIKADVNGEISKNLTAEEVTAIEF